MKNILFCLFLICFVFISCKENKNPKKNNPTPSASTPASSSKKEKTIVYQSDQLIIEKLSKHTFVHTSFLETEKYGNVPSNGMLVFNENEAVIFDTPATNKASKELIDYVTKELHGKIKAVIPTHFHQDCVAGLRTFNENHIPIQASAKTIELLKENNNPFYKDITPFQDKLTLEVGDKKVQIAFYGEGHTRDNIIAYVPSDQVIFGGCLIKELAAKKGNLEDANVTEWPKTVTEIKNKYPDIKIVIPGHGKTGGTELFDYTIHLFQ